MIEQCTKNYKKIEDSSDFDYKFANWEEVVEYWAKIACESLNSSGWDCCETFKSIVDTYKCWSEEFIDRDEVGEAYTYSDEEWRKALEIKLKPIIDGWFGRVCRDIKEAGFDSNYARKRFYHGYRTYIGRKRKWSKVKRFN